MTAQELNRAMRVMAQAGIQYGAALERIGQQVRLTGWQMGAFITRRMGGEPKRHPIVVTCQDGLTRVVFR